MIQWMEIRMMRGQPNYYWQSIEVNEELLRRGQSVFIAMMCIILMDLFI